MERNRTYECMCLLDNREVKSGWQPLKDSVVAVLQKHGAEVVSCKRWDERRLAYPIKGQQRATYLLTYFKAGTQQVTGIRRDLLFKDAVLRSLVLACEEVPETAFEPEAAFDLEAIQIDESPAVAGEPEEEGEKAEAAEKAKQAEKIEKPEKGDETDGGEGDGEVADDAADEPADDVKDKED